MNADQCKLMALARHEAGHTVVNAALGCVLQYTYIRYIAGTLLGMTEALPHPTMRPSEKVAVLLAGIFAARDYRHLRLNAPSLKVFAMPLRPQHSKVSPRLQRAIARYDFGKIDRADSLLPGGDGGQIEALLQHCRNPDRVFNRGAILAHRALAANERPLFQVAKHLLALGDLRGEALREILCEVVRIDPHSMDIR